MVLLKYFLAALPCTKAPGPHPFDYLSAYQMKEMWRRLDTSTVASPQQPTHDAVKNNSLFYTRGIPNKISELWFFILVTISFYHVFLILLVVVVVVDFLSNIRFDRSISFRNCRSCLFLRSSTSPGNPPNRFRARFRIS